MKNQQSTPCFGYYYGEDLVKNRPEGVPIHCVHVEANPDTSLVNAYIEYFGVLRVVCCLSSQYSGDAYSHSYVLDPTKGEELDLIVKINLSEAEIQQAYDYEKYDAAIAKSAFESVIGPAMKAAAEKEQGRVVENAVRYAFENCGTEYGEIISDEQHGKLAVLLTEKLQPWLLSQIVRGQTRGGA